MSCGLDLRGVVPPVVTPLTKEDQLALNNLQRHIRAMIQDGCSGVLLMGTTGEGPSMGLGERKAIIDVGVEAAEPGFVLAHTGCASLTDTLILTRHAYDSGADAAIVVPPFYYKNVTVEGLLTHYRRLLDEAVPDDGHILLYHIPQVSHVPVTFELLEGLSDLAPDRFVGLKDSSGDLAYLQELRRRFPQLRVFVGTDRLLLEGLRLGTAGCITAAVNVLASLDVAVYRAFASGLQSEADDLQVELTVARTVLEGHMPFPPTIKHLLSRRYGGSGWEPRPPLVGLSREEGDALKRELIEAGVGKWLDLL